MNQLQIQEKESNKVIAKAKVIATTRRVRRCECNPSIWCVQSENSDRFYVVQYSEELGMFICDCKSFWFSGKECKHIYACALKEGGYV